MSRRLRSVVAAGLSVLTFASVVVLATQAAGREASLAESNDGGAWLADRTNGGTAHVERLTRQWTSEVDTSEPGAEISVLQAPQMVAIVDRTSSAITVVDAATASVVSTTAIPLGTEVAARPGGLNIFDPSQGTLWSPTGPELASAEDLVAVAPRFSGVGDFDFFASRTGEVAILGNGEVLWPLTDPAEPASTGLPDGFEPDHGTFVGDQLVLVDGGSWLVVNESGTSERQLAEAVDVGTMQQSSLAWPHVGFVDDLGTPVVVDLLSGAVTKGDTDAPANSAPVVHDGCVHVLSGSGGNGMHRATCVDGRNVASEEPRLTQQAELKVVNDSVWIDLLDGSGFHLSQELELLEIADFSSAFEDDNEGEETADGENVRQELDQGAEDAELTEADQREQEEVNEPPVANDDEAATRLGRPVVVDVLANDTDPNFDVLLVESEVELISGEADLVVTSAANAVQVTPTGEAGTVTFRYQITDGTPGSTDTAVVTVDVKPQTQEDNQAPTAVLDRGTGAAGTTVSANLLENDEDPDGDTIVLLDLDTSTVAGLELVSIHPNGDVTVALPPSVSDGTLEIPYTIQDEWQAEAEGTLRLFIRLEGANEAPDARNDAGITVVGRRISIDLLANDVDADNDLLAVGQNALLLGESRELGFLETTEEGEFIFEPVAAGTYLFEYSATDRQESDVAIIRIEVTEPGENRPPIAQRDDVTLAQGERRLVRALENDGDPDGDVVGVIYRGENDALEIEPVDGVGFWVTMLPGAGPVEQFDYRLSDGTTESGLASVVVARSSQTFADAAPIVIDDSVRVRPGRSSQLFVLRNDYDPEGGPLEVTSFESTVEDVQVELGSQGQSLVVRVPAERELPFAISYTVADEAGNQQAGTVEVSIVPEGEPNEAPVARPDTAVTTEGQPVLIPVLANDSDPDSDSLSLTFNPEQPSGGVAQVSDDSTAILYTPDPGFVGTDAFTYLVQDSEGAQSVGSIRVGVMPLPMINQPPEALPDLEYVFSSGAGQQDLDVLDNDSDPDGDDVRVIDVDAPAVIADDAASVLLTIPVVEQETTIGFTYEIGDGRGGTDTASVSVLVVPVAVELPPVALPDEVGPVRAGEPVTFDVTANDSDPDGSVSDLVVTVTDLSVTVSGRSLVLTAPAETADYSYTITDPQGLTASSSLRVVVQPNLPPEVTSPDLGEFSTDAEFEIDLAPYATDPDGDELVFSGISAQIGGTPRTVAEVSDARRVIFLPDEDYSGPGGFSFTVDDGNGNQRTGRVTFTLTGPSNTAPEALPAAPVSLEAGVSQSIDFAPFFTDAEDDPLTFEVLSPPASPVVVESQGPTSFTIGAPITAEAADTSFTIRASDLDGETADTTVTVSVTATTAEPPLANPDGGSTNQGEAVTIDVVTNDLNRLSDQPLTIINVFTADGTVIEAGDGSSITFTPASDFFGTATIQYTVTDERNNADGEATGIVTVTVIGRPAAPTGLAADPLPPRSIGLTWRAPDSRGAAIERYDLEVNGTVEQGGTSPARTLNDLTPGLEYTFRVRAVNEAGEGEWSTPVGPVVVDQVPGAPGKPTVTFGDAELDLAWSEAPNEGSPIINYEVAISQCQTGNQTTAGTTYTWTGLSNGVRCSFQVRAENSAGFGPYSPLSDLECPVGLPGAPGQPVPVRGDKEATITFSQADNPDCEALLGYEIVRTPGGTTPVPAGTLQWTATELLNGESYTFEVRAENRAGWGPLSSVSDAVTPCGVPLAPPAPTAVRGDTQATVSLNGEADANGCAIENYQVSYNGGGWQDFGDGTVTGLTNGTSYTFQVRAVNEIGIGAASTLSSAVTPAGPPIITSTAFVSNIDSNAYRWTIGVDQNGSTATFTAEGANVNGFGSFTLAGVLESAYVDCRNSLGNRCLAPSSGVLAPPTACRQEAGPVSVAIEFANEVGFARGVLTQAVSGCPAAPSLSLSGGDGAYTASWSRPSGTDNIYIQVGGSYGSPQAGSSRTFSGANGTTYSVTAWACNEFGCSRSATQTVTPQAPTPVIAATGRTGLCEFGPSCRIAGFSISNFPTQPSTYECVFSDGFRASFSFSGSSVNTACYTNVPGDWIEIEINGVRSNRINN